MGVTSFLRSGRAARNAREAPHRNAPATAGGPQDETRTETSTKGRTPTSTKGSAWKIHRPRKLARGMYKHAARAGGVKGPAASEEVAGFEGYKLLWFTAVLTLMTFVAGLAVFWATPCGRGGKRSVQVEEPAGTSGLCRAQGVGCAVSLVATMAQSALAVSFAPGCFVWVPIIGLLGDSVAHAALFLRLLAGFVDAQHAGALLGYGRGVLQWSVWFDAKANSEALQAAATWCCLSFVLLLFALVSLGGAVVASAEAVRGQWHILLSYLVLVLGALLRGSHDAPRSQPPLLALLLNAIAGAAEFKGAGVFALGFAAALLLAEAMTAKTYADAARFADAPANDAQFVPPEDARGFEQFLHRERRLGWLYCWQELTTCERAWKREEREELWGTWVAQFAAPAAPFGVRGLSDLIKPSERAGAEEWGGAGTPPAGVSNAKAWLRAQLLAAASRFDTAQRKPPKPDARWCLERDRDAGSELSTEEPVSSVETDIESASGGGQSPQSESGSDGSQTPRSPRSESSEEPEDVE